MEVKINISHFMNTFDTIEKKLCLQTLNIPKTGISMDIDYNLYKDEFSYNALDLLKEYKKEININEKSEYVYLHRASLTKYDIAQRKLEFYENFKIANLAFKKYISDKLQLIRTNCFSHINLEILYFETKIEFEKFCKDFIPDTVYMNKFILKVNLIFN
jgi:hypothetical protein